MIWWKYSTRLAGAAREHVRLCVCAYERICLLQLVTCSLFPCLLVYLFMSSRFVNLALFIDSILLLATGLLLLETNRPQDSWLYQSHRYTGAVLIILLIPKTKIIWRSLKRQVTRGTWPNFSTFVSIGLSGLLILVLALALAWTLDRLPFYVHLLLYVTPLGLHWYLAFGLIPLFAWHAYKRWPLRHRVGTPTEPPTMPRISRRTALSIMGLGAAGLFGLATLETAAGMTRWTRRFTGSRQVGPSGNDFPVTNSDTPPNIDLATWRMRVTGRVQHPLELSYQDLLAMAAESQTSTVDCTLGWASTQDWRGVPIMALLNRAGAAADAQQLTCRAVTGYYADVAMSEARDALIATHVGNAVLAPEHGWPVRLVVPARRGFHWIKWLGEIEVS